MIVPDKQTRLYLDRPVRTKDIIRLCRVGILSPAAFLKAVILCRSDDLWRKERGRILALLARMSFLLAGFFLIVSEWRFFYTVQGGVFLSLLFVVCACTRRFSVMEYAGALLIGAMIFLPDLIFGAKFFLYEQFFLWFFLSVLWAIPSQRDGIRFFPLILLNGAVALYGVQFILPTFRMSADTFCILSAAES